MLSSLKTEGVKYVTKVKRWNALAKINHKDGGNMETQSIIEDLAMVPVGTIIAWVTVIAGILASVSAITVKLYKVFIKYKKRADENEEQRNEIKAHAEALEEIKVALASIQAALGEQRDVNLKQIRYSIVCACDKAISEEKISAGSLKSLMDLYSEYTDVFHGNGYVKALVDKVLLLPVVGRLE